jgi:SAM-dependent methyltransferase
MEELNMSDEDNAQKIRKMVREGYGEIAQTRNSCCSPDVMQEKGYNSCCQPATPEEISKTIGYSIEELKSVPEGANLGLGCGNPTAMASLKEGEVVLDLGSGAGVDCFLAANKVGPTGKVIGVDMTHSMLENARDNAKKGDFENVEFRLGEIEHLPVGDNSVDVIISNCVINLSPDKPQVFSDAFRVLKPGGRLMVSDMVLLKELPEFVNESMSAYIGCVAGAIMKDDYLGAMAKVGFEKIDIVDETNYELKGITNDRTLKAVMDEMKIPIEKLQELDGSVVSIKVSAFKPN